MDKEQLESVIHYNMAFIGGFFGAYALLNFHELFASAQTSNMIHIAIVLVGHNFTEFMFRLFMMIVYMGGLVFTVLIPKYTKLNLQLLSALINGVTIIILYVMPQSTNNYISLLPICFATAIQWNSFKGAYGYISSSIFSTNNLRQFTTATTEFLCDKDKTHLFKIKFYGFTLLFFHLGVALSYIVYLWLGIKGIAVCMVPVISSILLINWKSKVLSIKEEKMINKFI